MFNKNLLEDSGLFVAVEDILTSLNKRAAKINSKRSKNIRLILCRKQHGLCALCGKNIHLHIPPTHNSAATIDHIIPKSLGGSNNMNNLQLAHQKCNRRRSNKIIDKFPEWFEIDNHELI